MLLYTFSFLAIVLTFRLVCTPGWPANFCGHREQLHSLSYSRRQPHKPDASGWAEKGKLEMLKPMLGFLNPKPTDLTSALQPLHCRHSSCGLKIPYIISRFDRDKRLELALTVSYAVAVSH